MRHVDLTSGIGGFALAARWAGWETVGFCEIDPWCRQVLAQNFPGVPQHDDIKTLTAEEVRRWVKHAVVYTDGGGRGGWSARCDVDAGHGGSLCADRDGESRGASRSGDVPEYVLTAGYPCQPFSHAGKRGGTDDPRHLWPWIRELLAALGEDKPRWCVFENVAGHVSLGLDRVLADLEDEGYACWASIVPAAGVGALHQRDRVWIVAYRDGGDATDGDVADALGVGERRGVRRRIVRAAAAERGLRGAADGLPAGMDSPLDLFGCGWEYGVPLTVSGKTPDRVNRLKALGNAIVPQVAWVIFETINAAEEEHAQAG